MSQYGRRKLRLAWEAIANHGHSTVFSSMGADTWCPAMKPMSQIMFFNHLATFGKIYKSAEGPQVGRLNNGIGPVVERGQWYKHLVSVHGTNVSDHLF